MKSTVPNENSLRPVSDAIPRGEAKSVSRSRPCLSLANEIRRCTRVQVSTVRTLISKPRGEAALVCLMGAGCAERFTSSSARGPGRNSLGLLSRVRRESRPSRSRRAGHDPRAALITNYGISTSHRLDHSLRSVGNEFYFLTLRLLGFGGVLADFFESWKIQAVRLAGPHRRKFLFT